VDKPNMPVRRTTVPSRFYKGSAIERSPHKIAISKQKKYRRNNLEWLNEIAKVFDSVWNWFGGYFGFGSNLGIHRENVLLTR